MKTPKPATPHYDVAAAVVTRDDGRVLIVRRPPSGLLGGLWGFPSAVTDEGEALEAAAVRAVFERTGIVVNMGAPVATVRHAYTHFRITLYAFTARAAPATFEGDADAQWVTPEGLEAVALPVTDRKVANAWVMGKET